MCLHILANHVYLYKTYRNGGRPTKYSWDFKMTQQLDSYERCPITDSPAGRRVLIHSHMYVAELHMCTCSLTCLPGAASAVVLGVMLKHLTNDLQRRKTQREGQKEANVVEKTGLWDFCVCVRERVHMAVMVNQAEKTPHVTH